MAQKAPYGLPFPTRFSSERSARAGRSVVRTGRFGRQATSWRKVELARAKLLCAFNESLHASSGSSRRLWAGNGRDDADGWGWYWIGGSRAPRDGRWSLRISELERDGRRGGNAGVDGAGGGGGGCWGGGGGRPPRDGRWSLRISELERYGRRVVNAGIDGTEGGER